MLALRRGSDALRRGKTQFLATEKGLLAFSRGDRVLCLFNLSAGPLRFADAPQHAPLLAQGYADGTLDALGFAILPFGAA